MDIDTAIMFFEERLLLKSMIGIASDTENDAMRLALNALIHRKAHAINAPLTLDDLRRMGGEPVWIMAKYDRVFADVVRIEDGKVRLAIHTGMNEGWYGRSWTAHRFRPKGDGDGKTD